MRPLSRIENSTDASTCALRSHEKQGQRGTFTPKPRTKHPPKNSVERGAVCENRKIPCEKSWLKPPSRPKLPTRVHRAISVAASITRSDFDVRRRRYSEVRSSSSKPMKSQSRLSVSTTTLAAASSRPRTARAGRATLAGRVRRSTPKAAAVTAPVAR